MFSAIKYLHLYLKADFRMGKISIFWGMLRMRKICYNIGVLEKRGKNMKRQSQTETIYTLALINLRCDLRKMCLREMAYEQEDGCAPLDSCETLLEAMEELNRERHILRDLLSQYELELSDAFDCGAYGENSYDAFGDDADENGWSEEQWEANEKLQSELESQCEFLGFRECLALHESEDFCVWQMFSAIKKLDANLKILARMREINGNGAKFDSSAIK